MREAGCNCRGRPHGEGSGRQALLRMCRAAECAGNGLNPLRMVAGRDSQQAAAGGSSSGPHGRFAAGAGMSLPTPGCCKSGSSSSLIVIGPALRIFLLGRGQAIRKLPPSLPLPTPPPLTSHSDLCTCIPERVVPASWSARLVRCSRAHLRGLLLRLPPGLLAHLPLAMEPASPRAGLPAESGTSEQWLA